MSFNLQQGEKIIWESKPDANYRLILLLPYLLVGLAIIVPSFTFFFRMELRIEEIRSRINSITSPDINPQLSVLVFLALLILTIILSFISAELRYRKEYYWITNRRVIQKTGFLGYSIYSIPFERVTDVITTRGFLENTLGFGGLEIQSLAGQQKRTELDFNKTEGRFNGLKNPEEIQKLLFDLIEKNRKERKLTI